MNKCKDLPIDSFVLLTNFKINLGTSKKLNPIKVGPYKIVALVDQVTYRLRDIHNVQRDVHRNHLILYYPKSITLPPLISGYFTKVDRIINQEKPQEENRRQDLTVLKPQPSTSEKIQDETRTIKKKTEILTKEQDKSNTIEKRLDKSIGKTAIQFHQERDPGNSNNRRNLRLQPRKNYLVHTSLKKLMPLHHVQRRG